MERDKTATFSSEMSTVWDTKPKTTPQNTSSGTRTQVYDGDDDHHRRRHHHVRL
jgi:hypothetical protein